MAMNYLKTSGFLTLLLGGVAGLGLAYLPRTAVLAQATGITHNNLSENQDYIRSCRQVIQGVEAHVYDNSDLDRQPQRQLAVLYGGDSMRLTGVLRRESNFTAVQIYLLNQPLSGLQPMGWVSANKLTACQ